jgi:glycine oxidase
MRASHQPETTDVVVVGGGVIGLATAWEVARRGLAVTVVDPAPGRGASWAAGGMLAPVAEATYGEEPLLGLNLEAGARWPMFAAALAEASGDDLGYRECGTLLVARDRDDREAFDDLYAFQQALGLSVQRLGSREARALEPALRPGIRGGVLVEGDHQVDNRALVTALLTACRACDVALVAAHVRAVRWAGERVDGVVLEDGTALAAGTTVLAAGAASSRLEGLPDGLVPVRPVKGQLLHLRPAPYDTAAQPIAGRTIRGLEVYLVARADGRVAIGATAEERGYDTTVTAGGVRHLLRNAWELVPGIDELALVETVAGLRPGTPDNAPLLGPSGLDGLVVATGHFRHGVLLTPLTAELIADLLETGKVADLLHPFSPRRFDTQADR